MPLPALAIPISITVASAIAQLGGRLHANRKIRAAQEALQRRRVQHCFAVAEQERRQAAARGRIAGRGQTAPAHLASYVPAQWRPEAAEQGFVRRLVRNVILRRNGLDENVKSEKRIILPKAASTVASVTYKANSGAIMEIVLPALRPALAYGSEAAMASGRALQVAGARAGQALVAALPESSTLGRGALAAAPRAATLGGNAGAAGGGIAGRIALSAITVAGYFIAPALAALSIYLDWRKVARARRELHAAILEMEGMEGQAAAVTAELENLAGPVSAGELPSGLPRRDAGSAGEARSDSVPGAAAAAPRPPE